MEAVSMGLLIRFKMDKRHTFTKNILKLKKCLKFRKCSKINELIIFSN